MTDSYRPATMNFYNAEEQMEEGRRHIQRNGELFIDLTDLGSSNTVAVCALLAWRRQAQALHCRLHFQNIPQRLINLLELYQLRFILASPSP